MSYGILLVTERSDRSAHTKILELQSVRHGFEQSDRHTLSRNPTTLVSLASTGWESDHLQVWDEQRFSNVGNLNVSVFPSPSDFQRGILALGSFFDRRPHILGKLVFPS